MKIFLIVDETRFYQPDFIADLIRRTNYDFVGAALVTKIPKKHNIEEYMIRHWNCLKPSEILKLVTKKMSFTIKDSILKKKKQNSFYSVSSVFEYFGIDYFPVEYNINRKIYLQKIREKKPDVIISSNSLIFGKDLLRIPKYCINRHSALLPSYGGLWPVFQAVKNGELQVGVTVHLMNKKIDSGIILSQKALQIAKGDTIDSLYQKCFAISASVTIQAIENIESGIIPILNNYTPCYYSFPSKQDWKQLREQKMKFI